MCVCFLISEVVIIKKREIVEAKLHDESTMIQRCFDDNNDDNKRWWQRWWTKSSKDQRTTQVNQRTSQVNQEQVKSSRIKKNSRLKKKAYNQESRFKIQDLKNQDQDSRLKIQEWRKDSIKISIKKFFKTLNSTWVFDKTFTKEFLLSGNRLPYCCNRLPVAKWVWKSFQTEFTTFQIFSKGCNRLQCFGNRLPVSLNVEIQI